MFDIHLGLADTLEERTQHSCGRRREWGHFKAIFAAEKNILPTCSLPKHFNRTQSNLNRTRSNFNPKIGVIFDWDSIAFDNWISTVLLRSIWSKVRSSNPFDWDRLDMEFGQLWLPNFSKYCGWLVAKKKRKVKILTKLCHLVVLLSVLILVGVKQYMTLSNLNANFQN